ncbi:hypothetical protein GCM10010261_63570 [Streptomyces pilosus]|nr:hypothetical protein GCM10010261_63570 [Streptomyces pilosus]
MLLGKTLLSRSGRQAAANGVSGGVAGTRTAPKKADPYWALRLTGGGVCHQELLRVGLRSAGGSQEAWEHAVGSGRRR